MTQRTCQGVREEARVVWPVVALMLSIMTAIFGFGGVAATAAWIPQTLFFVFMIVALVAFAKGIREDDR